MAATIVNTTSPVNVWRGNQDAYTFFPTASMGSEISYTPVVGTYSPTTLMWDGAQFIEYFADGSSIQYAQAVSAGYLITNAISPLQITQKRVDVPHPPNEY